MIRVQTENQYTDRALRHLFRESMFPRPNCYEHKVRSYHFTFQNHGVPGVYNPETIASASPHVGHVAVSVEENPNTPHDLHLPTDLMPRSGRGGAGVTESLINGSSL
jgi:hypothetical protein